MFERHDGSKGIFKRDHHAGLPLDEFEAVFATFCFGTYLNGIFDIPESDLVKLFREACRISGIDEDPQKIALDAFESVCLLVKEGHDYVFCHRSFQEYFVAVYLRDYRGDNVGELYEAALSRGPGENVAGFLFEIDKKNLELSYVIPGLKRIVSNLDKKMRDKPDRYRIFANHLFKEFRTIGDKPAFAGFDSNNSRDLGFLMSIADIYPDIFPIEILLDFSKRGAQLHDFPIDIAKQSLSHSVMNLDDNDKRKVSRFSLGTKANDWFLNSKMDEAAKKYFENLKGILQNLEKHYNENQSKGAIEKFSGFNRVAN